jgi:hypothetical protein
MAHSEPLSFAGMDYVTLRSTKTNKSKASPVNEPGGGDCMGLV